MFTNRFGPSFDYGRPSFGYGPRRGSWGPRGHRHHRGGGIVPLLAAAFIARAAMQRGFGRHGEEDAGRRHWGQHPDHGHWGRGAWGEHRGGGEWGRRWGHGGPWGRGGWDRGRGDYDGVRAAFRSLRSEAGPIVGLLRDAFRGGRPDPRQIEQIKGVLRDARQRIAAILAESPQSMV